MIKMRLQTQTVQRALQEDKIFYVHIFTEAQHVEQGTNTDRFDSRSCRVSSLNRTGCFRGTQNWRDSGQTLKCETLGKKMNRYKSCDACTEALPLMTPLFIIKYQVKLRHDWVRRSFTEVNGQGSRSLF